MQELLLTALKFKYLTTVLPHRYSALKSLGERKACFNEYTQQRKSDEVLERRLALKKAREDFNTMLEECAALTAGTRLSKAALLLENDSLVEGTASFELERRS